MMHLAHANVARMRAPLESAAMASFARALDPINGLAERSPGFVWRFRDEEDPEAARRVFGEGYLLLSLSVWASIEAARAFTYGSGHGGYLRRRAAWFEPLGRPAYALWWVDEGRVPTPEEARDRLDRLAARGPTPEAFSFSHPFDPPSA